MKAETNFEDEQIMRQQEVERLKADYQTLFDENPLAMLVADKNTSKIIGVNKAALIIYGYTQEEFLKLTLKNISNSPYGTQHSCEGRANYTRHYKKHGQVLYVEVKENEIFYRNVLARLIAVIDVTCKVLAGEEENKKKQRLNVDQDIADRVKHQILIEAQNEKLKSNEVHLQKLTNKLEKIMSSSLDIICTLNTDGYFVQVSEACKQVLGYAPEEMMGKFVLDFVDPEYIQLTQDAGNELTAGKDLISFQNVYVHKNGRRVSLNWSARFDAEEGLIFAVARNTSSQAETEKLKAAVEQRFAALVQKGADMVGIMDPQGTYTYVSPNVETILGYKPECLLQLNALQLIHPDDLELATSELEKVLIGGEAKLASFRFKHANGEWRLIETIATNQLNNPAINGIVLNSRDVTARNEIETERELMIKELLKSNADLKQFSFITSHNLRAPLSNIIGILNIIDYSTLDDYNKQMIDMLDISAKQLQQTIDDLSKILVIKNNVNIEISHIDLEEAINEVKRTFINTLNDVCATIDTDFKIKEIYFNKIYLQSILVNLVSNSIKYQSSKRNLLIKVSCDVNEHGQAIFKFSDNGSGIDLCLHKNKVFGLYQRFHDNTEGHGLGLFIIKSQIVALGGKIEVESEPGMGTTFIITFKNRVSAYNAEKSKEHNTRSKQIQAALSL